MVCCPTLLTRRPRGSAREPGTPGGSKNGWKCALFSPHSSLFDTVIMNIFWTHCDDPFKRPPHPTPTPPTTPTSISLLRQSPAVPSSQDACRVEAKT